MIIPITYPSSGEFWLNRDPYSYVGYSFNNRILTDLPSHEFEATSRDSKEVAAILSLNTPLSLSASHENYKRRNAGCVVYAHPDGFPPKSFLLIRKRGYDIYVASPELSFLLAARTLDLIDLIKLGYDLCALYYINNNKQADRTTFTFINYIRNYLMENINYRGAKKALRALKYVRDYSNSPMETKLAMFAVLPSSYGGCGLGRLELNKHLHLCEAGRNLTGYSTIMVDLFFNNKLAVEYNSNQWHLDPSHYTDDMNRQTALNLTGYKCIAVTFGNIKTFQGAIDMMNAIRKELSLPPLDDRPERKKLYYRIFGKSPL